MSTATGCNSRYGLLPRLRTAKTSATHTCGSLRSDNGPLSLTLAIALRAARLTPRLNTAAVAAHVIRR